MTLYRGPGGTGSATSDADTTLYQDFLNQTIAARDAALQAEINAELAETNAETAETNAETAETNAETAATNAASSASAAASSASSAATSASNASTSASAASASATAAASSASSASSSASAASTSASNAATSETNAANSASSASTSATNAANSASTATTQASNAASSATAAASSASSASTSATNAANSASAASTSATNAANSATAAAASASEAAGYAASINPADLVHISGTETITGAKTFSQTITGSITGNAGTVTNGVYTTGDQTIAGTKTFSSNPILSAGTTNGLAFLNASKVLTTGSALTFDGTNLGIGTSSPSSVHRLTIDGVGTVGNPSSAITQRQGGVDVAYFGPIARDNNTDLEWWNPRNGFLRFATNNTERMRLTSAGDLGIGTSSPGYRLQVYNNINGTPFAWGNATRTGFLYQDASGVGITNAAGTSFDEGVYLDTASSRVVLYTNSVDRLTLDSSGNLGLGMAPSAWASNRSVLQLKGGTTSGGAYLVSGAANQMLLGTNAYSDGAAFRYLTSAAASLYSQFLGEHTWSTAPSGTAGNAISFTQAMTLASNGRLLLGTTTDSGFRLAVDSGAGAGALITSANGNNTVDDLKIIRTGGSGAAGVAQNTWIQLFNTTDSNGSGFQTFQGGTIFWGFSGGQWVERARIDSSGNLLVGKTADNNSAGITLYPSGNAYIVRDGNTALALNRLTSDGIIASFSRSTVAVGSISVTTTATAYNTSSDYRLKDNPQPLTGSGAFIDALQPKTWDWKIDGSKGVGFLAHEAQAVSPSSVTGEKDAVDEEGKPIMQAMEYGSAEFIANIIAELQSLRARVAALESN